MDDTGRNRSSAYSLGEAIVIVLTGVRVALLIAGILVLQETGVMGWLADWSRSVPQK